MKCFGVLPEVSSLSTNVRVLFRGLPACAVLVLCVACGQRLAAQEIDKALIVGTVTDTSGAVLPNTLITVREISTNATFQLKTNSSGFYTSPQLQIGTYEVTAEMHGFAKTVQQNIILDVGVRKQVDFSLSVGSSDLQDTDDKTSPTLETTSGTVS
jgi:hypothetical protein